MKYAILSVWIALTLWSNLSAQDIDVYQHHTNAEFRFPAVPRQMDFREFDLLSTQVRMQDIFASTVMPGYIHFRIYEKRTGYWLVGLRCLGYGGLIYLSAHNKSWINLIFNPLARYHDRQYKTDIVVADASAFLIVGTFLYDWIHGRYLLQHKQAKIRFKYAPVVAINPITPTRRPALTAGVRFQW